MNIPDNYDAFVIHDAKQEDWLNKRPVCEECGEHIQDEYLFEIAGVIYCEECVNDLFRKDAEDYERR